MKHSNIFAYTAPGIVYPPFISVNHRDDMIEVTIRNEPFGENCGSMAAIKLTVDQAKELASKLLGA